MIITATEKHQEKMRPRTTKKLHQKGLAIKSKWKNNIIELKSVSFRVSLLILKINDKDNLGIVQVYAPTSSVKQNGIDVFFDNVEKALIEISKNK